MALPSGAKEATIVYALEDFPRWRFPWNVVAGNPLDLRRGRYVFIDDSAERRFGPFAVGDYREFLGLRLKIIGRTREARSFTTNPLAFLDYRVAQALAPLDLRHRTTYILVKLAPGADHETVRAEIRRRLPYNDVRTKDEWAARSRNYWVENTGLGLSMYMTVFLGCLVGVVVVAQTSYTATMEHFKEFAIVKAIGGCNADIYRIIAEQAIIAAVVGFLVGTALAYAVRPLMAEMDLKLIIPPILIGDVFLGARRTLPGGLVDLVPQDRRARSGDRLPRLIERERDMAVLEARRCDQEFRRGEGDGTRPERNLPGNWNAARWSCSRVRRDRGRPRCSLSSAAC